METFTGELYSYTDARRRAPDAWRDITIAGDGWSRTESQDIAPKGLGHFERMPDGKTWVYVRLNGYASAVSEHYGKAIPPPLPRPTSERREAACHDGPHACGACGQPTWIELHGVADGYCTYCYYAG